MKRNIKTNKEMFSEKNESKMIKPSQLYAHVLIKFKEDT